MSDHPAGNLNPIEDTPPIRTDASGQSDVRKALFHAHDDVSPASSSSADPFSHITVKWGPNIEDLLGYTQADTEPTMSWWLQRIHPDDRDRIESGLLAHFARHESYATADARLCYMEYRMRKKDGNWLFLGERMNTERDLKTGLPKKSESFSLDHQHRHGSVCPETITENLSDADNFQIVAQNMHSGLFMWVHSFVFGVAPSLPALTEVICGPPLFLVSAG